MLKYSIVLQYILYNVFNVYIICKYLNIMNSKTVLTADQILKVIRSFVLQCLLNLMKICFSIVVTMELEIGNNTAWYIVKFLEENSVEAVPVNWFKDLNHCYWPPYKDTVVAEAIRLNEVPSKSWKLYNCKLLSKSKIVDYPAAMKKACRAQYESELSEAESTTNNSIKRIKKKNKKYDDTMSDEEYSTPNKRIKLIPSPPTFGKVYHINILPIMLIYYIYYFFYVVEYLLLYS